MMTDELFTYPSHNHNSLIDQNRQMKEDKCFDGKLFENAWVNFDWNEANCLMLDGKWGIRRTHSA
jgi:hypothetical protein